MASLASAARSSPSISSASASVSWSWPSRCSRPWITRWVMWCCRGLFSSTLSRATVSDARTISPSMGGIAPSRDGGNAGKDRTLVGLSLPRQPALSALICASSEKTMLSSDAPFAPISAKVTSTARSTNRYNSASSGQAPASTVRSISNGNFRPEGKGDSKPKSVSCAKAAREFAVAVIGLDDLGDQRMPDHVAVVEAHRHHAGYAIEHSQRFDQTGFGVRRQVDLARIAGDDHPRIFAKTRQKHLHLHRRGVLRFVENDGGMRQRAPAHKGERRDL